MDVIAAANVLLVDKYLRDAALTIGTFCHFGSSHFVAVNFVLGKINTLPPQQQFGTDAVRASLPGVDFYMGFDALRVAVKDGVKKI